MGNRFRTHRKGWPDDVAEFFECGLPRPRLLCAGGVAAVVYGPSFTGVTAARRGHDYPVFAGRPRDEGAISCSAPASCGILFRGVPLPVDPCIHLCLFLRAMFTQLYCTRIFLPCCQPDGPKCVKPTTIQTSDLAYHLCSTHRLKQLRAVKSDQKQSVLLEET